MNIENPHQRAAPSQQRSQDKLDRLMDAATKLMNQRDLEDVRIADIAEAAGVSTGTVYQRFSGREDMFGAVITAFTLDMEARVRAAIDAAEPQGPMAVAEALSHALVADYRANRGLMKAATRFWSEGATSGPVGSPIQMMAVQIGKHLLGSLQVHMAAFEVPNPERTISQGLQFMFGILMFEASTDAGPLRLDGPWIEEELVRMFCRYTSLSLDNPL